MAWPQAPLGHGLAPAWQHIFGTYDLVFIWYFVWCVGIMYLVCAGIGYLVIGVACGY